MNCVDFDKHFESYVRQWSKENMARYKNVDAMEADIPEVYLRWLNEPCDWLSGRTPGNYFAQFDDAKFLCKWLCDYVKKKVPCPTSCSSASPSWARRACRTCWTSPRARRPPARSA